MKTRANILIIDDDQDVLASARLFLKAEFTQVDLLADPSEIPSRISRTSYDVILLDMNFRKGLNDCREGFYWLKRIREYDPMAVVILITAYGEVELAVRAMKEGATDFVMKPWKNMKLLATINGAIQLGNSRREVQKLRKTTRALQEDAFQKIEFIGESPGIMQVKELIKKVAPTDANILILGENGTGKELVARSIHLYSTRAEQPFVQVDLGSISTTLFASELFGHKKGAFTDAQQDKTGRIEIADGGTLFLDEIGNLSLEMQPKLLSAIQQKEVIPVGDNRPVSVNFRLISATNNDLARMVSDQKFREDLLYRLNTVEVILPPLRERKEDIPALLDFFAEKYAARYKKPVPEFSQETIRALKDYPWPGNIRELQHTVERAIILSDEEILSTQDLIRPQSEKKESELSPRTLDEMEKNHIEKILGQANGNVTRAAEILGITRTAMYRRLNKYNIK